MKRLIALALVLVLAQSMLTACGGGGKASNRDNGTPTGSGNDTSGLPVSFVIPNPAASDAEYELYYGTNGMTYPVRVVWDGAACTLSVTYPNAENYFQLPNIDEAQSSKLYKHSANGNFHAVSGVTSKIVETGDVRSGTDYGTVVLAFFDGSAPYTFEDGVYYAVIFDISASSHRHGTVKDGDPFVFVGSGKKELTGNGDKTKTPGAFMTKEEVGEVLTNFDISMVYEVEGYSPSNYRQVYSDKGLFFESKSDDSHYIDYFDLVGKMGYELDVNEKTGEFIPLEPEMIEMIKGFHYIVSYHLFMHDANEDYRELIGGDTVIGRPATVYAVDLTEFGGGYMKIWVDDEYGFTLKYEQSESNPVKFSVTDFKVGGAKVEGLINLDEYKLEEEGTDIDSGTGYDESEIVEGVLSLAALRKTAEDMGYTEFQGSSAVGNYEGTLPKPMKGFTIGIVDAESRSTGYNIAINEFISEEEAGEYAGYVKDCGWYGNVHLSGKFTAVFIGDDAENVEPDLMAAFESAGWVEDLIPEYVPPVVEHVVEHSEALQSMIRAAEDWGYTVTDDYYFSSFSSSVEPVGGFSVIFSTGDVAVTEFASEADAQAYKADSDEPDSMFPVEHIIYERFLVRLTCGFSDEDGVRDLAQYMFDLYAADQIR